MNLFTWLLIGHMAGDWILQNHWMASLKRKNVHNLPLLIHCSVYTTCILLAFLLAQRDGSLAGSQDAGNGLILLLIMVFGTHWLIDGGDLAERWGRFYRQSELILVRSLVDQSMHLIVLGILAEVLG